MADSTPTPPLTGPAFVLPSRIDRLAERWARLPWRLRAAILLMVVCGLMGWHIHRVSHARGNADTFKPVWIANETLVPGSEVAGKFRRISVPAPAVPELAITDEPSGAPVLTIVSGTVATSAHFDGVNKAPPVPNGHRAVAVGTQDAELYAPGTRVDLWDTRSDPPILAFEQLIVVSVKGQRVVLGVPDDRAGVVVQLEASKQLRISPAGTSAQPNTLMPASSPSDPAEPP